MVKKCVFIVGYMGVGKSTGGKRLAQLMGSPFFDTDLALRDTFNGSIPEIFDKMGEAKFRESERQVLMGLANDHPGALISTGGGAACHPGNMDFMLEHGTVVYFQMKAEDLTSRLLGKSDQRPLLSGISAEALPEFIAKHLSEREPHYRRANIIVDAAHLDSARLKSIQKLIQSEGMVNP